MKIFRNTLGILIAISLIACNTTPKATLPSSTEEMLDIIEKKTFNYFWDGAEENSGMARERYHIDGIYPENDHNVVTSGGSGFGIMAIIAGMDRGYITRDEGVQRIGKIVNFLENSDSYHGVFPHWWYGDTGKMKGFSDKDNGGDLVETSFLVQGLLTAHQYLITGSGTEKALAARIDTLWKNVEWDWHTNGDEVLYWHWSPNHSWEMNFPIRGFNEALITYILAASSPTHGVSADVYHKGWAENGAIIGKHELENHNLDLRYQSVSGAGPLFWAHYSFLGLDPNGLKDQYTDYFQEMKNYTLINRDYCIRNPKEFKGYNKDSWGLSASYTVNGYTAHEPHDSGDRGVIAPTAAVSSIVYTPNESMDVIKYLYLKGDTLMGDYGFYDAYSETENWYPKKYLAIDQGPQAVMIENYRSGLLWNLFMSHPDVQNGLRKLGFESPHIK